MEQLQSSGSAMATYGDRHCNPERKQGLPKGTGPDLVHINRHPGPLSSQHRHSFLYARVKGCQLGEKSRGQALK